MFDALGWDKADWQHVLRRGQRLEIAFSLMMSGYLGEPKVSLSLEDLRT